MDTSVSTTMVQCDIVPMDENLKKDNKSVLHISQILHSGLSHATDLDSYGQRQNTHDSYLRIIWQFQ